MLGFCFGKLFESGSGTASALDSFSEIRNARGQVPVRYRTPNPGRSGKICMYG